MGSVGDSVGEGVVSGVESGMGMWVCVVDGLLRLGPGVGGRRMVVGWMCYWRVLGCIQDGTGCIYETESVCESV